jgi:hypothetical protein
MPFVVNVNYLWFAISAAFILVYLFQYRKMSANIWYAIGAIVLLRLIYAAVFLPVKYEHTKLKYDREMANIAAANKFQPLSIYKPPEKLDLVIDLKISKLNFGTFPVIPHIAYQMPYYYYQYSGQILRYDTVLHENQNYIGFMSNLRDKEPDILYSFKDKNQFNEDVVLFKIPSTTISTGSEPFKATLKK